jgi:hypothetical protein
MCESLSIGAMSAVEHGKELMYDSTNCVFTNSSAASAALRRTYRKGWEVAGLSS